MKKGDFRRKRRLFILKKRLLFLLPIIIVIIATIILLDRNKENKIEIFSNVWNNPEEKFVLCEIEVLDKDNSTKWFIPKNQEKFIEEITSKKEYVCNSKFTRQGCFFDNCYFFLFDDSMFAVCPFSEVSYCIYNCVSYYSSQTDSVRYAYPSPVDWKPDKSWEADEYKYDMSMEQLFGSFDEAVKNFYGFFTENIVNINKENKTISVSVYDVYSKCMSKNHKVVIDFDKGIVTEVVEDNENK